MNVTEVSSDRHTPELKLSLRRHSYLDLQEHQYLQRMHQKMIKPFADAAGVNAIKLRAIELII